MNEPASVTIWLRQLKEGPHDAAVGRLWERYFERMVRLAGNHLRSRPRAAADEEDVALAAFDSFVRAVERKRFPKLEDRNDLWRVLFTLTERKTFDQIEKEAAARGGAGAIVQVSALAKERAANVVALSREPGPQDAVAMTEGLQQMLDLLGKKELMQVAVWRMEGYTDREIALKLNRSIAAVERKLKAIRTIYRKAGIWE